MTESPKKHIIYSEEEGVHASFKINASEIVIDINTEECGKWLYIINHDNELEPIAKFIDEDAAELFVNYLEALFKNIK